MLSLKRVAQSMHALIGQLLSEATLLGYVAQLHRSLAEWERHAIERLLASPATRKRPSRSSRTGSPDPTPEGGRNHVYTGSVLGHRFGRAGRLGRGSTRPEPAYGPTQRTERSGGIGAGWTRAPNSPQTSRVRSARTEEKTCMLNPDLVIELLTQMARNPTGERPSNRPRPPGLANSPGAGRRSGWTTRSARERGTSRCSRRPA